MKEKETSLNSKTLIKDESPHGNLEMGMSLFTLVLQLLCALLLLVLFLFLVTCSSSDSLLSGDALVQYKDALVLFNEGRYSEAAKKLESLRAYYGAQLLRGKAFYFRGAYSDAEKALRESLRLRPSSVEGRLYLAYTQRALGKEAEAQKLAEDILADDPDNIRAYRILLELTQNDRNKANLLNQALEAAQETAFLFVERARYRWISGDGTGALQDISAALSLIPTDSMLRQPIAALQKTITTQMQGGAAQ
ncbi:MAG: tetratricopeptide repeat protein [Spirochaetota bacterium]